MSASGDRNGVEKVLYRFGPNERYPMAGLTDVNGTLYGTTSGRTRDGRGRPDFGTVFSITPGGVKRTLYRFHGPDGANPNAGLLNVHGTLYGTTFYGGDWSSGVVYGITTAGKEKLIYSFKRSFDGANPDAALINVKGTLYGTTEYGGYGGCYSAVGCGTVYSITPSGSEKVLYVFNWMPDGDSPTAGLIDVKGKLYGTTLYGGRRGCPSRLGCGTVFTLFP